MATRTPPPRWNAWARNEEGIGNAREAISGAAHCLDCVLIAICATLFSKNVISLMYREVAGLVLLILLVVHAVFNRKRMSRVFRGRIKAGKSKATLVVNALPALSFVGTCT